MAIIKGGGGNRDSRRGKSAGRGQAYGEQHGYRQSGIDLRVYGPTDQSFNGWAEFFDAHREVIEASEAAR